METLKIAISLYLAAIAALLASAPANGTTNQLKMELKQRKRVQITTTFETSSTLQKTEQDGREAYGRIVIAPSYAVSNDYRIGAAGQLTQIFNEERKTVYGNTKVTVSRIPLKLTNDSSLALVAGGRLPTNSEDRDNNTYRGSVLVDPRLLSDWNIAGYNFSSTYRLILTKNFHKYDRNNVSAANIEYSIVHYVGLDFPLIDKLVFTLEGDYTYDRSYQATVNTAYSLGQALTYQMPKWSVTVGHTNAANMLAANGRDINVSAFDKHTSAIYGALQVIY